MKLSLLDPVETLASPQSNPTTDRLFESTLYTVCGRTLVVIGLDGGLGGSRTRVRNHLVTALTCLLGSPTGIRTRVFALRKRVPDR